MRFRFGKIDKNPIYEYDIREILRTKSSDKRLVAVGTACLHKQFLLLVQEFVQDISIAKQ